MGVDKPLLEVTKTPTGLEYSIHGARQRCHSVVHVAATSIMCHMRRLSPVVHAACPRRHRDEIESVFPGVGYEGLLIVPTCQAHCPCCRHVALLQPQRSQPASDTSLPPLGVCSHCSGRAWTS